MKYKHNNKEYDTLENVLEVALPTSNTGKDGQILPMLATDWEKVKKKGIPYPCLLQPKLDGVRCLMVVKQDGIKYSITMLSRNGKTYTTLNHIVADVDAAIVAERIKGSFILDGEIYSDELNFQEIISAVKKQSPDSLKLKFRAYDIVNDDIQEVRWETTKKLVDSINSPDTQLVVTRTVNSEEEVISQHDLFVKAGYEGVMLRYKDGIYGQGQRSRSLLKVKVFDHTEFTFTGFEVGKRPEDLVAVCQSNAGEFRAKMEGTAEQKRKLQRIEQQLKGTDLTVKHFGYTESGQVRFPVGIAFRNYE